MGLDVSHKQRVLDCSTIHHFLHLWRIWIEKTYGAEEVKKRSCTHEAFRDIIISVHDMVTKMAVIRDCYPGLAFNPCDCGSDA